MTLGRKKALNQYGGVAAAAEYATPHRLVQMLMEGVLDKVATAKGLIDRNDLMGKGRQIGIAMSIITALRSSLDMEAGGQIAANLDDLYGYINNRLIDANVNNDLAALDEVTSLMGQIKSAWDAMPEEIKQSSREALNGGQSTGTTA